MKAAKMTERPNYALMKQGDVQSVYHMQMPRWLFSDPRYAEMSLDAKVTYTFLLNRFQLSRRNGWVNENNEVFVIFTRKMLAKELRICEQRVTAAFRKLAELKLIWEKRCGRGDANQIYLARVEPIEDASYECAPFISEANANCGSRTTESEVHEDSLEGPEPQNQQDKSRKNGTSRSAEIDIPEPQSPLPSYTEVSYPDLSHTDVSLSVPDGQADEERELTDILDACELSYFSPEAAHVFENAIERLFYSDSFRLGTAQLPQHRIRRKLRRLDSIILREAEQKLHANLEKNVRNSTAYVMVTLMNCISEVDSDLMVDPYLNSLQAPPGRR